MSTTLETLLSYTPTLVQRCYASQPHRQPAPIAECYQAALLVVEIDGLIPLAEQLIVQSTSGITELNRLLNTYFGQLLDLTSAHGGEVLLLSQVGMEREANLAGDVVLVLWTVGVTGKDLTTVTRRAASCALALQTWSRTTSQAINDEFTHYRASLGLRMVINAGDMWAATIGGVAGRWEFLMAGPALTDLNKGLVHANLDDIIVTPAAWCFLVNYCNKDRQDAIKPYIKLHNVLRPLKPRSAPPIILTPETESLLRSYISPIVLAQLDTDDNQGLATLCQVSVLFLRLEGLDYARLAREHVTTERDMRIWLTQVQEAVYELQQVIFQFGGNVIQLFTDNRDVVLIAAWGIPLYNHVDNAVRAVRAAQKIHTVLHEHNWHCSIGISTGQVCSGNRGNANCRHFDLLGTPMQYAARLMQAAHDAIFCDEATYQVTQQYLDFKRLPSLFMKQRAVSLSTYRLLKYQPIASPLAAPTAMIGRRQERQQLIKRLQALQRGESSIVIIEGVAGIGKSRLGEDLLKQAELMPAITPSNNGTKTGSNHLICLVSAADATEKNTPYYVWRSLFAQLFRIEFGHTDPTEQYFQILTRLQAVPNLVIRMPLLNVILPLPLFDNELTAQMHGDVRIDNTHDLLIILFRQILRYSRNRYVLVIEDAHWMDTVSCTLLQLVSQKVQPLLLVLITRPRSAPLPSAYQALYQQADTQHIFLEALTSSEMLNLAYQRLNTTELPSEISQLLLEKANGNPLFGQELMGLLYDQAILRTLDGFCQLIAPVTSIKLEMFSTTLLGIIINRINRLIPMLQLILQAASVIGRTFHIDILQVCLLVIEHSAVSSEQLTDRNELISQLLILRKFDIVPLEHNNFNGYFIFRQSIIQECAYHTIPITQRRQLHRIIAEWYETSYPKNLEKYYSILAFHYNTAVGQDITTTPANILSKAILYSEKIGEQVLNYYTPSEMINFFNQLQRLSLDNNVPIPQQANWLIQLGKAYLKLGQMTKSWYYLQQAAKLLKQSIPATRVGLFISSSQAAVGQVLHRLVAYSSSLFNYFQTVQVMAQFAWFNKRQLSTSSPELVESRPNAAEDNPTHPTWLDKLIKNSQDKSVIDNKPYFFRLSSNEKEAILLQTTLLYEQLTQVAYFDQKRLPCLQAVLNTLNLAEQLRSSPDLLARAYTNACIMGSVFSIPYLADLYGRLALKTVEQATDISTKSWVFMALGIHAASYGRWTASHIHLAQAIQFADKIGDKQRCINILHLSSLVHYYQGQFRDCIQQTNAVYTLARRFGNIQAQVRSLCEQGIALLRLGDVDTAVSCLKTVQALPSEEIKLPQAVLVYGLLTAVYARQGLSQRAVQMATKTATLLTKSPLPSIDRLESYASVAYVYLTQWEGLLHSVDEQERYAFDKLSKQACQLLYRYAKIFPIAQPRAWLLWGLYAWLANSSATASKQNRTAQYYWQKSLKQAVKLEMLYEQGLVHYEIARHLPATDPDYSRHVRLANEIFTKLHANYDLQRVQDLLKPLS